MTESTDFKEPPFIIADTRLVTHLAGEANVANGKAACSSNGTSDVQPTTGDVASATSHETPNGALAALDDVPPELTKRYYFGCGPFHPKWLQIFVSKKLFTFLLCCFAFIQGSIVSGFTSVVLSTIQKRYDFSSTAAGFVAVSYDASVIVSVIFVSYFGGKSHKPRWLGVSLLIMSIGCFIFASPEFLFGIYNEGSSLNFVFEGCRDERNFTSKCTPSDDAAYAMFIIGNLFIATGAAPLFTVGQAYLDEIVRPKYLPIHIGLYHAMAVVGPAFGYAVGSSVLSIYVDPWIDTTLVTTDPAWVGAWWLSFVLAGVMAMILSIPFLMFPRYLPDSHVVRKERAEEMAKIYSSKYANEDNLTITVKMFPVHIKRLLFNLSFMFASFGLAILFIMISGLVSFAPKYVEIQFQLTATFAGLLAGGVGIVSATCGVFLGALILFFTKMKGRKVMLFTFVLITVMILFNPSFLIHCPSPQIVGVTTPFHNDSSIDGVDSAACVSSCGCSSHVFEPVCGADGLTYFSPCRAGCISTLTDNGSYIFNNCSCVANGLNDTGGSTLPTATDGMCTNDCNSLVPFILILICALLLVFITQIPFNYFTMRVVADDQRSLALGVQSAIWRIFGTVPGPLIFGAVFDASCLKWQGECGLLGNCWVYDNWKLSLSAMLFGIPCLAVASVLFFLSWLTFPKQSQATKHEESAIEKSAVEERSNQHDKECNQTTTDVERHPSVSQRPTTLIKLSRKITRKQSDNVLLNGAASPTSSSPGTPVTNTVMSPS